ncbi:NU6M oxidoreductase, partial [Setophaga kirtlandii]|nr:NU6M oxidoreductase [Setophaga kirtlandii]
MGNFVTFLGACFILGEFALVSYPFYYYGVVGLVLASVAGCVWLVSPGTSFVLLVLFVEHVGRISAGFVHSVPDSLTLTPFQKYGGM